MKRFLKRICQIFLCDWDVKYSSIGTWNISGWDDLDRREYSDNKYCRFEFEYSQYLNEWRLRCYGYRPKEHNLYLIYVNDFKIYCQIFSDPILFEKFKQKKYNTKK